MKNQKFNKEIFLLLIAVANVLLSCSSLKKTGSDISIFIDNPHDISKKAETVEIPWSSLKGMDPKEIIIKSVITGIEIPSQVIYNGKPEPQFIIFQTDIAANTQQKFLIQKGIPSKYPGKTYGRQVPERFDDFAWENDLVAFRMYGEALESQKGNAKGIDFWAKRTSEMVINKWYKTNNYHKDNGDGVDAYHVGITLGAGNAAPIIGDKIIYPLNYSGYEILDQGPIRISFKLMYKPFMVNNQPVKETKFISLDAGHQMNKIINSYETGAQLKIAMGVTKHTGDGIKKTDTLKKVVAYWDKADGGLINGFMGVGIVYPSKKTVEFKTDNQHLLMITDLDKSNELMYYQGGSWSKSGNFDKENDWFSYLTSFSETIKKPLSVKVK